jgi:transcriptional regulator with XRE-family HTH domain
MSALKLYKSYNFTDKDPIIDKMSVICKGTAYRDIEARSGVSTSTLYNWFHGKTQRPQFATVAAVARCLGYDVRLIERR